MRLENNVAIITGAGRGIGRATAVRFAEEGAGVVVADIDLSVAGAVAAEITAVNGKAIPVQYVATKAGVVGMTKVWARELEPKGIRVNAVAPGFINTRMTETIPDKVIEKLLERVPMNRMGEPEEIANAYLFLASDEASYINGHVLAVDGGTVL